MILLLACASSPPPPAPTPAGHVVEAPERYDLGRPATAEEIAAWDLDVDASWAGLPAGHGTVAEGATLYAQRCAACHGPEGEGGTGFVGPRLVATVPKVEELARDWKAPRAVGNWWAYTSTLFDYVRRAMPQSAPGTLTADETYALVAWLLARNGALPTDATLDDRSIREVVMPSGVRFTADDRLSTSEFR